MEKRFDEDLNILDTHQQNNYISIKKGRAKKNEDEVPIVEAVFFKETKDTKNVKKKKQKKTSNNEKKKRFLKAKQSKQQSKKKVKKFLIHPKQIQFETEEKLPDEIPDEDEIK